MTKLTSLAAAIAACGLMAGAAQAHPQEQERTMRVYVGDLNVHNEAGARQALSRIRAAASRFCGPTDPSMRFYQGYRACIGEMTGKAVAKLDAPRVTALYQPLSRPIELASSGTAAR